MKDRAKLILIFVLCSNCSKMTKVNLESALEAEKWIRGASIKTTMGKTWYPNPEDSTSSQSPSTVFHIYHGTAGIVLFYLEMFNSTGNKKYLTEAEAGANYLIETLPDTIPSPWEVGLYSGLAGVAFTLEKTYEATKQKKYREQAFLCIDLLEKAAVPKGDGVEWGGITDIIYGSAGIGMLLLYADREMGHMTAKDLAIKAGLRLLETSVSDSNGTKWRATPATVGFAADFAHGTAGISYFLASLYESTNREEFLKGALEGARYLESVTNEDGLLMRQVGGETLYYLGWCSGPAGTSRLYYKLWQLTGDDNWMDKIRKAAATIMHSGIPEKLTPGFWNNVSRCCGSVAVAEFYLNLYKITNEKKYLDFSRHLTENLLSRATVSKGGLKWTQAEHRLQPEFLAAQTGYMQGAAGIGVWLLHLDAFEHGTTPMIVLPDSPFLN